LEGIVKLFLKSAVLTALLAFVSAAQNTDGYLDYYIAKVKPEKRADFDALAKKFAEANRKNHGDTWLAYQTEYGENNTVYFSSSRKDMGSIEKASAAFMGAIKEAFGPNAESTMAEFEKCLVSSRSEIRRRRWDLSVNAPADQASVEKYVGAARWIRVSMTRVRPGHVAEYEDLLRKVKSAVEAKEKDRIFAVTQVVAGQVAPAFYLTTLAPSFGDFDHTINLREIMGEEGYREYARGLSETTMGGGETIIGRFLPALSNPPEGVVQVSSDFWTPKQTEAPMAAARAKKKPKQ
jgi:quinol monooxygenase YgiN